MIVTCWFILWMYLYLQPQFVNRRVPCYLCLTFSSALAHTSQGTTFVTYTLVYSKAYFVCRLFDKRNAYIICLFASLLLCSVVLYVQWSILSSASALTSHKLRSMLNSFFALGTYVTGNLASYSCTKVVNFRKKYSNHFSTYLLRIKFLACKFQVPRRPRVLIVGLKTKFGLYSVTVLIIYLLQF